MSHKNLQEAIQAAKNPVNMLRNSQIGPYAFPVVPSEFTNWRDEQRSWRETCALFDQSHHMTDLYVEGPDALKVFADLGINTFNNFRVDTAKQFVACNHDGYVIGDAILFHLEPNKFNLVGRPPALNWVQFHVETGGYNAKAERDERSFVNRTGGRKVYRYQVQGPNAAKVMAKATGKPMPDIKFFNMSTVDDRRPQSPRAAPRHGRPARLGAVRAVGRGRRRARRADGGRQEARHQEGRRAHVSHEHARVRMDSVAAAGRLHGHEDEAVPRVARGKQLRGDGVARRQLRVEEDRGLLPHAVRLGLRLVREVRPRVRRPQGAREAREESAAPEGHARVERRRRAEGARHAVLGRPQRVEVHRLAARELRRRCRSTK